MEPDNPRVLVLHGSRSVLSPDRLSALAAFLRGVEFKISSRLEMADLVLLVWTGDEELPSGRERSRIRGLLLFEKVPADSLPESLRNLPQYRVDTLESQRDLWWHLKRLDPTRSPSPGGGLSKGTADEDDWPGPKAAPFEVREPPRPFEPPPPREAYARLDAPEVAVAGEEIEVAVGLAEKPSPGVAGGPMKVPETTVGAYTLTVQLVAEGFRLREGETWRRELPVTGTKPWPAAVFHLTPDPQEGEVRARLLQAFYEVSGQTMGMAFRPMVVKRSVEEMAGTPELAESPGVDLAIPTDMSAPDLEVRILLDPDRDGRLLWTFASRHGLDLPDEALRTDIGNDPKGFARHLVDDVNAREGMLGIYDLLAGTGVSIAEAAPDELWTLLRGAAEQTGGRPPDVLILSAEPYVPWELARMEEPLIDPTAPPFLAAQANLGRWVLPKRERAAGSRQRPQQPPPMEVEVSAVAVVTGVYDRPKWSRLKEAEAEAEELGRRFKAAQVNAATDQVLQCLRGTPPAELLHFAVHGTYDPGGLQDGLMLVDGMTLAPSQVRGARLDRSPFVFLNACQVGSGNKILGDYSGMAADFLMAGASGVVAPLWSVKDTIAREIALSFYKKTAEGMSPAAALREARKSFLPEAGAQSATWLAYQFFGHPSLKLRFSIP